MYLQNTNKNYIYYKKYFKNNIYKYIMNTKIFKSKKKALFSPNVYMKSIYDPIIKKKKLKKMKQSEFEILKFSEYDKLTYYNYNVNQLKTIARYYKIRLSGNKPELLNRIYNHLKLSNKAVLIQSLYRKRIVQNIFKLNNLLTYKIKNCTNETDFFSLQNISDIPCYQLILYRDESDFIYGFDILSLFNLFERYNENSKNPYNRSGFLNYSSLKIKMKKIIRLCRCINVDVNIKINTEPEEEIETYASKMLTICQEIDLLGNYTDINWFINLSNNKIVTFIRELYDIWNYRANLSNETQRLICPPNGRPFSNININTLNEISENSLKRKLIRIIKKFIYSSNSIEQRKLGAVYVLSALTLVNVNAAVAMPWLYESVMHN